MARLWQSGPHLSSITGDVEFTTVSGTVSIQNTVTRIGPFAIRTNPTAGTAFVRQLLYTADSSTNVFFRAYVRFATFPGADATICRIVNLANDPGAQFRFIASTSKIVMLDANGTAVGSPSATLSTNTWYRLELNLDGGSNPGSLTGKLDGTTFATGAAPAQFPWQRVLWGTVTSVTMDAFWCDIAVNDSSGSVQNSWPGSGVVKAIFPDSTGDANGWNNTANTAGSTSNWQLVDEIPPNDATDMVQTGTLNAEDMYNMGASGLGASDTVNCVMIGARYRNNLADTLAAMKVQVKKTSGGTILQSAALIPNDTSWQSLTPNQPRIYPIIMYLDPDNTVAWTQATLDTMQVGQKLTATGTNRVQVTTVWASIDYTPSSTTPISASDTGAGVDAGSVAAAIAATETGAGVEATGVGQSSTETGAGVDAGSVSAAISSADTAAGVDAASLTSVTTSATETATGVDAVTANVASGTVSADTTAGADVGLVTATLTNADTAGSVDAATVAVGTTGTDTGSGIDAGTVVAAIAQGDTAAGVETTSLTVTITTTDIATAVDTESVNASSQASGSDTGSGVDAGSVAAAVPQIDVAAGIETTTLAVSITATDIAAGVDTESLDTSAEVSGSETGAGVDTAVVSATLSTSDTGSGAESASLGLIGAETGAGVEQSTLSATLAATETALGAEATTNGPLITETSSGADAATVTANIFSADTGTALENQIVTTDATPISGSDTAAGAEAASTTATQSAADTATGVDAVGSRATQIPEIASAADAGVVLAAVPVTDIGGSAEGAFVTAIISVSDASASADASSLAVSITQGDTGLGAEANDPAGVQYNVTDLGAATDAMTLQAALNSADLATATDNVFVGLFSNDAAVVVETGDVETGSDFSRSSSDLAHGAEDQGIAVAIFATEGARATEGYDVHVTKRRVHKVMPYYIRERQDWAIEQERRRHNQALWYVGENTMFVLMWHLEDFQSQLVNRCPTCYESQGMIAEIYGQTDEYKCPDCFGTTFEGGFKAIIVRPAIFSDSDEGETKHSRGVIHPNDLSIDSTPDFRVRTGDYCFRQNGDRFFLRVPERITLRTGFGDPSQGGTAIAYNHANAAQEDPSNVSYMIPPATDEVAAILSRMSRIPRPWNSFEVIRAPLIPGGEFAPVLIWNNTQSSGGSPVGGLNVPSSSFLYQQQTPSMVWTITHDLGHQPADVMIFDTNGAEVDGIVSYPSPNQVRIDFAVALAGSAHLS